MDALGRYTLVRKLASGGMGELHLARLEGAAGWARWVAVKTLLPHLDDPEFLDRFFDEASIATRLSHGGIVQVLELGESDGTYFLAMEYVDGWDLRRLARALKATDERIPDRVVLHVAQSVCDALCYAHRARDDDGRSLGIVHRDVSPSNVLLSREGVVKLADFGIAAAHQRVGKTVTGQLRGKFAYMSPEQAEGRVVDCRSDLFALGTVIYELLAGERPFDAESDMEILALVREARHRPLSELRPDLPSEVHAAVERALTLDPDDRFQDAEEMLRDLGAAATELGDAMTTAELARWLGENLPGSAGAGPNAPGDLDALLNAQLDGFDGTPSVNTGTPSVRSNPSRPLTPDRTRTRAVVDVPGGRRRRRRSVVAWTVAAAAVIAAVTGAWVATSTGADLVVRSEPSGAEVFVDGVPIGVTGVSVPIRPGRHELRVRLDGFEPVVTFVDVARGQVLEVNEHLDPADVAVAFHSVPPGATVRVGEDASLLAGNSARVPVGQPVMVRYAMEGYRPLEEEVVFDRSTTVFTRTLTAVEAPAVAPIAADAPPPSPAATEPRPRTPRSPTPEPVEWTVVGVPADYELSARGAEVDGDTVRAPANADSVVLIATSPGGTSWERRLDATTDGGTLRWEPGAIGTLLVRFRDEPLVGEIFVNESSRGQNTHTSATFELPVGTHALAVRNADFDAAFDAEFEVSATQTTEVIVEWE